MPRVVIWKWPVTARAVWRVSEPGQLLSAGEAFAGGGLIASAGQLPPAGEAGEGGTRL